MLKAELHNKLGGESRLHERSEDVLTSNVFGSLESVPPALVLFPWLRRSVPLEGNVPLLIDESDQQTLTFWPRIEEREIDLVLRTRSDVVGIECKYASGKSNREGDEGDVDDADVGDQLAYYLQHLRKADGGAKLLYLTTLPSNRAALEESAQRVGPRAAYYELSWGELEPVLAAAMQQDYARPWLPLLRDLRSLLEKKGLRGFRGFEGLHRPLVPSPSAGWKRRFNSSSPPGGRHGFLRR